MSENFKFSQLNDQAKIYVDIAKGNDVHIEQCYKEGCDCGSSGLCKNNC